MGTLATILLILAAAVLGLSVRTQRRRTIAKQVFRPSGKRRAPKKRFFGLAA